jgi:hypothetical protein
LKQQMLVISSFSPLALGFWHTYPPGQGQRKQDPGPLERLKKNQECTRLCSVSFESQAGLFTVASPPRLALGLRELAGSHPVSGCEIRYPKALGHIAQEEDDPEGT